MAGQRDPVVTLAVLGVMGFVGWQWAQTQPANSSAKQTVDRIRSTVSKTRASSPAAPAAAAPAVTAPAGVTAPQPTAGVSVIQSLYQLHDDGGCWLDTQWSDGSWTSQAADPSHCASHVQFQQTPDAFPGTRYTVLTDLGGFPVVFNGGEGVLEQDPILGGTNVYGPGDSFIGPDGTTYTWLGRADLLQGSDGSVPSIDQLFA